MTGFALSCAAAVCPAIANASPLPAQAKYEAPGPSLVSHTATDTPCARRNNLCDLFFPSSLQDQDSKHALILWGNGSDRTPSPAGKYDFFLTHLASWGFVVVATQDGSTGSGETMLDTLEFMKAANNDPQSRFFHKLDLHAVAAAGHSQGASGAANALLRSNGAISTAVMFHIPQQAFCSDAATCLATTDLREARSGSYFYVSGTRDFVISPDSQLGASRLNSNTAYYEATPSDRIKVKAILRGANHNDITGRPDCPPHMMGCKKGAPGYLGYPTAWLAWRLLGASDGPDIFREGGELSRAVDDWQSVRSNIPP